MEWNVRSAYSGGPDLDALVVLVHAGQQDGHLARALEAEHVRLLHAHRGTR